jgi:hypothetical protein
MTPYQFWHCDKKLITVYQKAYYEDIEYKAHRNGYYVSLANHEAQGNTYKNGERIIYPQYPIGQEPVGIDIEKIKNDMVIKDQVKRAQWADFGIIAPNGNNNKNTNI